MSNAPVREFDHLTPPLLDDPYPLYEQLRREAPVTYNPAFQMWFVSRHEDVLAILRDPARFSSAHILDPIEAHTPEVRAVLGADAGVYPLLASDPPLHTRVRSLAGKAFSSQRLAALEPRIRAIATELIDAFAADGEADLVARFAEPLPIRLTGELFRIPVADMERIKRWCDDETVFLMAPLPPERRVELAHSVAAYRRYLRGLIEQRRAEPGDDLVSELIQARIGGESPLSTEEIVGTLCVLIFAAHLTTTNMLGNALLHLLRREGAWQRLRESPALIPGALEESMRFDAPVQGLSRTVTEDCEVGGVKLARGARLFVLFASANRDPACTPDPDRFDLERAPTQHLAFGRGPHFCIGAQLARMEGAIALELLTRRLPDLRLAGDEPPGYLPNLVHRGPGSLRVTWSKSPAAAARKRWLVTGGAGFLGINLVRHLLAHGQEVTSLDVAAFDYPERDRVRVIQGDIRSRADVERAMEGVDIVCHTAAALPLYTPEDIRSTDIDGTDIVIDVAHARGVERFIHISSTAVYGIPDHHPLREDDRLHGVGPYGEAKIAAEMICVEHRHKGMCVPIIRPKSFIGPERLGVFAMLYDWARDGRGFPILGNGRNRYQLLDVADLCDAIWLCATVDRERANDTFNVGAAEFTTMAQDFQAVLDRAGFGKKIQPMPAAPLIWTLRALERLKLSPLYKWVYETAATDSFVSIEKAQRVLGWQPRFSNQQALVRNYEWYLANLDRFQHTSGVSHRVPWKQGVLRFAKVFF